MARPLWSGFLSFGLVNVPVGLFSATADHTVRFNQIHKGTSNRIRYRKVDEATGEEVDDDDIVNGYPLGGGEYVVVSPEELKNADPGRSETIEITDFVDLDQIDPVYFRQSYYLAPHGKGADRAYALLGEAMRETNRVGIATIVMRGKEHLVAVRPGAEALTLETMYFADEIRDARTELGTLPAKTAFQPRELAAAKQLVDALATDWSPANYRDTYRDRVEALIEQKRKGHAVAFEAERPKSNVVDLMAALEASVARPRKPRADARGVSDTMPAKRVTRQAPARRERESFEAMSKTELLGRASELGVQGRSKMSKAQLVIALGEASRPKRPATRVS